MKVGWGLEVFTSCGNHITKVNPERPEAKRGKERSHFYWVSRQPRRATLQGNKTKVLAPCYVKCARGEESGSVPTLSVLQQRRSPSHTLVKLAFCCQERVEKS